MKSFVRVAAAIFVVAYARRMQEEAEMVLAVEDELSAHLDLSEAEELEAAAHLEEALNADDIYIPKDKDGKVRAETGRKLDFTPFQAFDIKNPLLGPHKTTEVEVWHIIEKPRFGKLNDYLVYNLGPKAKPFDEPRLIYEQDNKIFALDANIIDPGTNKRVLQWRGYRWLSARVRVRAFLTSEGWNGGEQSYYTMTKLSSTGTKVAYHYETTHGTVGARSGWFSKQHTYTVDSGRCTGGADEAKAIGAKAASDYMDKKCGKRLFHAVGDKTALFVNIYPNTAVGEKQIAVASLEQLGHEWKVRPWMIDSGDAYQLTVQPGQDALLLANFACFIDASENLDKFGETKTQQYTIR